MEFSGSWDRYIPLMELGCLRSSALFNVVSWTALHLNDVFLKAGTV